MKPLTILCLLTFSLMCNAQSVPGYMGKRWSICYDAYLFPSFANTNSTEPKYYNMETGELENGGVSLNFQNHLRVDYAISKKSTLGLDFSYAGTYFNPLTNLDVNAAYLRDFSYLQNPSVRATGITLAFKRFKHHYAPLGIYWEYKIGLVSFTTGDFQYTITRDSSSVVYQTSHTVSGINNIAFTAGIGYGFNRVINDIVVLSMGLDFTYFSGGYPYHNGLINEGGDYQYFDGDMGDSEYNREVMVNLARGRLFAHYLMNIRFGVGILL